MRRAPAAGPASKWMVARLACCLLEGSPARRMLLSNGRLKEALLADLKQLPARFHKDLCSSASSKDPPTQVLAQDRPPGQLRAAHTGALPTTSTTTHHGWGQEAEACWKFMHTAIPLAVAAVPLLHAALEYHTLTACSIEVRGRSPLPRNFCQ
jgi:hypothetical protein